MSPPDIDQYDDPLVQFLDGITNPATRDYYVMFIRHFFEFLKLEGNDTKANASAFAERAKLPKVGNDCNYELYTIPKMACRKNEITSASIGNYYKPVKLFCVMNDILLNWDKITKTIPKSKRHSADRIPTHDELKKLIGYTDRRLKPTVLVMISSDIRLGVWENLRWGDIEPIERTKKQSG